MKRILRKIGKSIAGWAIAFVMLLAIVFHKDGKKTEPWPYEEDI